MTAIGVAVLAILVGVVSGGSMVRRGTLSVNGYRALLGFLCGIATVVVVLMLIRRHG